MDAETTVGRDEHMQDVVPDSTIESVDANRKRKPSKATVSSQFTIRKPPWSYLHLSLVTPSTLRAAGEEPTGTAASPDAITVHMLLQSALRQFLGLHGTAIPINIFKIQKQDVWIRVPREDSSALMAALGGWIGKGGEGWRVKSSGCWGPQVGNGSDLFEGD